MAEDNINRRQNLILLYSDDTAYFFKFHILLYPDDTAPFFKFYISHQLQWDRLQDK